MKLNLKTTLLTGSAIVALGAFGATQAQASSVAGTDTNSPTVTTTYTSAQTGGAPSGAAVDNDAAGLRLGGDAIQFAGAAPSTTAVTITVNGVAVTGGAGLAAAADADDSGGAAGGAGGHAVNIPSSEDGSSTVYPTLTGNSTASFVGGAGATASATGAGGNANGGTGGAGGSAAYVDGNYARVTGAADFTGGAGGAGGNAVGTNRSSTGGAGGAAINLVSDHNTVSLTSGSAVAGGAGGLAGTKTGTGTSTGGAGGAGIKAAGASASITIGSGVTVTGGTGGASTVAGADGAGISIDGASATVSNAGTITGGHSGAGIALDVNAATAVITNTGTIGGSSHTGDAIDLDATGTTTSLTNSGTVQTTTGNAVDVTSGDTLTTLTNSGTIAATTGKGVVAAGTLTTLTNSGTISSTTGGTSVDASGTLTTLTNSGTISTTTGKAVSVTGTGTTLTNSGTLSATTGQALYLNSTTGPGTITNTGGTMTSANVTATEGTLTVDNVALPTTTITGGTIANTGASGSNAIYITGGTDQTNTFTLNNVTVTGDIESGANIQLLKLDGTTAVTGNIALGAGNDTLTLSGGSVAGTIDMGANTNVLTVEDAFTTGGTISASGTIALTVANGGTLTVNHAVTTNAAALGVNSGGTLHLDGADVTNGGALTNAGTITIDTGRTLTVDSQSASTGTFRFGVGGGAAKGQLVAVGASDLTNSNVVADVDTSSGFIATNDVFHIVDGGANIGGITGTASSTIGTGTVTDNSYVLSFQIVDGTYAGTVNTALTGSANDGYLIATRASAASIGTNANNDSVATALVSIDDTGVAAVDAIQGLLNDATTQAAANEVLEAVSPTVDTGAADAAVGVAGNTAGLVSGRLAGVRGAAAAADDLPSSVWLQGFGGVANQDERDSVAGYDSNSVGLAVGADTEVLDGKSTVGAAFSYGKTNVDSDNAANAKTDVNSYQLAVYGDYDLGNAAYVEGLASYGWSNNDSTRHATAATTQDGSFDANLWNVRAEVGRAYDVGADGLSLVPNVSANYWRYSADAYTETGTGALLNVGDSDLSSFQLGLGVDAKWSMMNEDGSKLEPVVRVGYAYDTIGDHLNTTSSFVGSAGTTFDTNGADAARSTFNVGAGVNFYSADNWQIKADYDFNAKSDYTSHTGVVRAGYRF